MTDYNVYCDESCHLEKDNSNVMVLGAVWCPQQKLKEINTRIKAIKHRNNVDPGLELKWTKVSPAKAELYKDLVNYYFDNDDLFFRALIIPNKSKLDHKRFEQTHDDWYHKMYFEMLKTILDPKERYEIYIDIKDTRSNYNAVKLREVCCNSIYDFSGNIIKRLQPIRSDEIQIMQIVDILIGAVGYVNRKFPSGHRRSPAKLEIIDLIKARSGYSLQKTTLYKEQKCNIFVWDAR